MRKSVVALALSVIAVFSSSASATTLTLDTTMLPSTQGWTYVAIGDGAGVPESGAFSVSGGELHQTTLGIGMTQGGGNLYYRPSGLNPGDSWSMTIVARVNGYETVSGLPFGFGMGGEFGIGSLHVGFGQAPIAYLDNVGAAASAPLAGFDPSVYNTYMLSVVGGLQSFSVNGVSVFSNQPILGGGNPAQFFFGDGTGFANADANIRSLVITTPGGVPEPASWALMITGFGLVGAAMRRRATKVTYA
jgi:hypothetical protein